VFTQAGFTAQCVTQTVTQLKVHKSVMAHAAQQSTLQIAGATQFTDVAREQAHVYGKVRLETATNFKRRG
jgi:hypothetical protein